MSQSSLKQVLVSNDYDWESNPGQRILGVAILFEASPGFQPKQQLHGRRRSSHNVAILFEASPGFQLARVAMTQEVVATGRNPL
jgi:hypothetical protein